MKRLPFPLLLLILMPLMIGGCRRSANFVPINRSQQPIGLIDVPVTRMQLLVSSEWLRNNINDPNLRLIHVARDRQIYENKGHIPGARYLDWAEIATTRGGILNQLPPLLGMIRSMQQLGIDKQSKVVLYDDEQGLAAARAYVVMDYLGLGDRTALLDGQMQKWLAEGNVITTETPETDATWYVPRVRSEILINEREMRDLVDQLTQSPEAPLAIIDSRPAEEFSGEQPGEGISRPGHIPGAVNIFWKQNLVSEANPVFKSVEELREIYMNAGVGLRDQVAVYCRTGAQASLTYFTLKYLGYTPQLYDGSFFEWQKESTAPVVLGR